MVDDDDFRDRVIVLGGKVAGVDCPECEFDGRDVEIDSHTAAAVHCPNCGTTLLTADQKTRLRRNNKL